jgi:hypothetical protein
MPYVIAVRKAPQKKREHKDRAYRRDNEERNKIAAREQSLNRLFYFGWVGTHLKSSRAHA